MTPQRSVAIDATQLPQGAPVFLAMTADCSAEMRKALAQRVARQPEPDEARHIMTTWLRSRGGPVARAGGYLVELYMFLRARGVPPSEYDLKKIKADAADNARELARLQGKAERGVASPSEVERIERRLQVQAYCEGLVAGGEAARGEVDRGEGAAA